MEELQDAIEDAQYVNEISTQEDGPRPVLRWEIPSEEQLASWKRKTLQKDPDSFTLDWTLGSAIGLFLFSSFLKDICKDYLRMNFCEEVIRWRRLKGSKRVEKANSILKKYVKTPKMDQEKGEIIPPKKTDILEHDLERPRNTSRSHIDEAGLKELYDECYDPSKSKSLVGISGRVRDELFTKLRVAEKARRKAKEQQQNNTIDEEKMEDLEGALDEEKPASDRHSSAPTTSTLESSSETMLEGAPEAPENAEAAEEAEALVSQKPNEEHDDDDDDDSSQDSAREGDPSYTKRRSAYRLPGRLQSTHPRNLPDHYFDQAEAIVMESLRREYWDAFLGSEKYTKFLNYLWYQDRKVVPEDFLIMRVLGRGGFGVVNGCKKGTTGKLYAMKVMNKKRIKMKKSEQLALNERAALEAVQSSFVVNLKYSFQDKDDIYLILDLMTGGDLGYHLQQKGRFPKDQCRYYAARIMLGLQALHDKGYVYRDLKPENCLLGEDGRVKISDLGLATQITPTLHGAAGTRGYWAPEMLRRDRRGRRMPYGHTVDWFSFGCCLAEFISGQNPFRSEAALNFGLEKGKQTKEKAIDCATLEMEPEFDSSRFDEDSADLCRELLNKDEKVRIGVNGCQAIMQHRWFEGMVWADVVADKTQPPFEPPKDVNAAPQSEIGTFAEDKAYQETVIESKDDAVYQEWDWTNKKAFAAEVIEVLIYEGVTGMPLVPQQPHGTCCCVVS